MSEEVSEAETLAGDVRELIEQMVEHLDWDLVVDVVDADPEVLEVVFSGAYKRFLS